MLQIEINPKEAGMLQNEIVLVEWLLWIEIGPAYRHNKNGAALPRLRFQEDG